MAQHQHLDYLIDRFRSRPEVAILGERAGQLDKGSDEWCSLYETLIPLVELDVQGSGDATLLGHFQGLFRDLETLIPPDSDERHRFLITIPVADRPHHLSDCLDSLLELCRTFHYGGFDDGTFRRVEVVIIDDSLDSANLVQHGLIASRATAAGLTCHHLSHPQQRRLLSQLSLDATSPLRAVIGDPERESYAHKGASVTRNIAYLKLKELIGDDPRVLCYFIDSDQEFRVPLGDGDKPRYAINYLYHLDRLFRERAITILTGKVVGDPPVSPSVMASNMVGDVIALLDDIEEKEPDGACSYHDGSLRHNDEAAYHDMADLFGFRPSDALDYPCPLTSPHSHQDSLGHFAANLGRFFDGEHPTRKSFYEPESLDETLKPARTIYTGNYVFNREGLDHFIPFADLKLRMAGPTLGRLLKATLGKRFVSANLPMLHKRTVESVGRSEFRPGIDHGSDTIDLAGEFERQFYGDVMLFSIEALTESGFPTERLDDQQVNATLESVDTRMRELYRQKQQQIIERLEALRSRLDALSPCWKGDGESGSAAGLERFYRNIVHNFSKDAAPYRRIGDDENRRERLDTMRQAIGDYRQTMAAWHALLWEEEE